MAHETATKRKWKSVTTSFDVDLSDVVQTSAGPFAVGGSGTVAANRGNGWETVVTEGPAKQNRTLSAVDVTEGGARAWYAGASGAIGMYDVTNDEQYDFSYSKDISGSWTSIAVTGRAGTEQVYVANTSGIVLPFSLSGSEATYGTPATPGGGSEITALSATHGGVVYATDTSSNVYSTARTGWRTAGIENVQASLLDVTVGPNRRVFVAAANGTLYAKAPSDERWTADEVAGSALRAVAVLDGHVAVLSANNDVFRRPLAERTRWESSTPPTGNGLQAVVLGTPDVAVGKAGTVVTRAKAKRRGDGKPSAEKPRTGPTTVCDLLRGELVSRLDRVELIEALERRETCKSTLVELLKERREGRERERGTPLERVENAQVLVLPVATTAERAHGSANRRLTCECRAEPAAESAFERLLRD